jgi:hypothetical protein
MCPSPFYGYTGHGRLTYRKISDSPVSGAVNRIVIRYPVSRQVTKTGRGGNREEDSIHFSRRTLRSIFAYFGSFLPDWIKKNLIISNPGGLIGADWLNPGDLIPENPDLRIQMRTHNKRSLKDYIR